MNNAHNISAAEEGLYNLLSAEIAEITDIIRSSKDSKYSAYVVEIPEGSTIDLGTAELASIVARSSNVYGRMARFAGLASAYAKLAKGRYERKYKSSKIGNNEAERERNAMSSALAEHSESALADAISEVASAWEAQARVASESARKLYKDSTSVDMAATREARGGLRKEDFVPF